MRMRNRLLHKMEKLLTSPVQELILHLGFQPFKELLELCLARVKDVSCQN